MSQNKENNGSNGLKNKWNIMETNMFMGSEDEIDGVYESLRRFG